MQNPPENKKNFRTISIKKEQYEKMVELGSMGMSFADVMEDIMKKADLIGASATAATKEHE